MIMKKFFLAGIVLFMFCAALKSDLPAYRFYDVKGKMIGYEKVVKAALDSDVILFGELHNSPICHWLELELTKELYAEKKDQLVMGAEMFETDDQLVLDEYFAGKVKEKNFEAEAKLWDNYKTDYKPLVQFAMKNKIPFVATNVPRRYASLVNKSGFGGLDSLSAEAKAFLPPLPVAYDPELKCYKDMLAAMGGDTSMHVSPNIPKAQAIKDATMAYNIFKNWKEGKVFIHYNGTYHSDRFEGIVWYLKQSRPDLRIMTISSVEQDDVDTLASENKDLADFILCIPSSMSKSY